MMQALLNLVIVNSAVIAGGMFALWLLSLKLRDASIVDGFWGLGFVVVTWVSISTMAAPPTLPVMLVAAAVSLWGLRLSVHIISRNWGHGEDYRYAAWRAEAGAAFWWRSLFQVFVLQGLLILAIAAPILWLAAAPPAPSAWHVLGLCLWTVGMAFETIGDWQLRRFKANPDNRGQVMQSGLWRYTRHPNYFGDALVWWGIAIMAIPAPLGWLTLYSPLLMTWFLLRISGVPLLEKRLLETKPAYAAYAARTSPFLPLPPRQLVIVFLVSSFAAFSLPTVVRATNPSALEKFELRGEGVYRHWGMIKVFTARLYAEPGADVLYPPNGHRKALELTYDLSFDADDFANVTRDGIRQVVGDAAYTAMTDQIERFNRLYRNIEPGDRYRLVYDPGNGTTLYWNDIAMGTVEGQSFAAALFGIWLSERSMDNRLRQRLLQASLPSHAS